MLRRRALACVLAALGILVASAALALAAVAVPEEALALLLAPIAVAVPALVGTRIVWADAAHPIGWILVVGPLGTAVALAAFPYAAYGLVEQPGSLPGAAVAGALPAGLWPLLVAWPVAIGLLFPDGRPLGPRWRPVVVAGGLGLVAFAIAGALSGDWPGPPLDGFESPLALSGAGHAAVLVAAAAGAAGILVAVVGSAVAVVLRVRRSAGVARAQALWLAWGVGLVPAWLVLSNVVQLAGGSLAGAADPLALSIAEIAVAAAVGIAILRHRLYDIERLVSRTVVYALLSVALAAVFALLSIALGVLFGSASRLATAGATLGTALAFAPGRRALQDRIDRRFARARFEAVRRTAAFEQAVRDGLADPEEVVDVLRAALATPGLAIAYPLAGSEDVVDTRGRPVEPAAGAVPFRRRGRVIAWLAGVDDDATSAERRAEVMAAAGLTLEMARLRVELRVRLREAEEAHARMAQASYDERRRLERDLHDGAQQRLVSLGVQLRLLQGSLPPEARVLGPSLDAAVDEVARAIRDLRTIAAGIRPPHLDEGLRPALADLARNAPVRVVLEIDGARLPGAIEEAAYYVAAEAITNAVKHAGASEVAVSTVQADGVLRLAIADDGVGGAVRRPRSGLGGVADRVAALGGQLEVTSPRGAGTRVEAVIPCGS